MKIRTLATTALVWVTLLLIGKQLSAQSLTQLRSLQTEDDLSVMVQAIEMTTPTPASTLPLGGRSGTYYSAQFPSWPPLPANLNQVPVWSLGGCMYLLDDTNVDYTPNTTTALSTGKTKSGSLMAMDASGPPSPGGGGSSTNVPNNYSSTPVDYGTNLCLAQLYLTNNHVTAVASNTTADIEYEVQTNSDLTTTNWGSFGFILGSELTNWTPLNAMPVSLTNNLFFRLKSWADSTSSGIPDWWWLQYFGQDTNVDPYADPDGDGWNNLQEFQNGTDPTVFNTPPTPQGLTANYNSTTGTATFNWLPAAGNVTGYTLQITDYQTGQTTNVFLSASATSFQETVSDAPYDVNWDGSTIYISSQVQAEYATNNSAWSDSAWLENANPGGYIFSHNDVNVVAGRQGSAYLVISSPLPASVVTLRLSKYDYYLENFVSSGSPIVTNYDISVSAFTNGIFQLPADWIAPQADAYGYAQYDWWMESLDAAGNVSIIGKLTSDGDWSGYYAYETGGTNWLSPPYFDGRVQLKQNLKFLLRTPYANSPFYYQELYTNGYTIGNYAATTNYAYASVYNSAPMLFGEGLAYNFNVYAPFEENYRYRNFVFNLTNTDSAGNPTTGVRPVEYDIDDTLMYLFDPPLFQVPLPATNGATVTAVLGTNDTRWLDTSADMSDMGVGWSYDADYNTFYTMTNGVRNFFGLPDVSTEIVWGNTSGSTFTLSAGSTVENLDNNNFYNYTLYLETEQPQFSTAEYDFWNLNSDPLPGNPVFSPTNASRQFFMPVGSQVRIAGYAKLAVTNGYPGVYGYLGQYFDQAYAVDTNGIVTTNATGILSSYGDFFATEPGQAALVTTPDVDTGERGTCMMYCVSLALDKNHDGNMDLSFNGADATSQNSPMEFWVNSGHIVPGNNGDLDEDVFVDGNNLPDYSYGQITCQRDLENFARLWICGVPSLPISQNYTFTLSLTPTSGHPAINVYDSCETNGGTGYLTDTNIAAQQADTSTTTSYGMSLGTVSNGVSCTIPNIAFAFGGTHYLLFEGAGIGSGQLILTISQNGNVICQTSAYLDLHDVKDFYEQAHITGVPTTFPAMIDSTNASTFISDHELPSSLSESNQLIVFVHGWRMGIWDYQSFSDTMFKRLYWAGYQGRFAALRWPTLSADDYRVLNDLLSYTTYNRSEYIAHRSADGASAYFDWLKSRLPNYSINVAAHSMGNIVMMETLKDQLAEGSHVIDNYVMMQAAVPAQCYDTTLANYSLFTAAEVDNPTPDVYRGFPGNIAAAVNGQIVNFFNTNDFALATGTFLLQNVSWEGNQLSYKPDTQWNYSSDGTNCSEFTGVEYRTVTDPREQMAFVARPRSKAVGALGDVGGMVETAGQVDLNAVYGFDRAADEHSAEFNWTFQQLGGKNGFYHALLNGLFPPQ